MLNGFLTSHDGDTLFRPFCPLSLGTFWNKGFPPPLMSSSGRCDGPLPLCSSYRKDHFTSSWRGLPGRTLFPGSAAGYRRRRPSSPPKKVTFSLGMSSAGEFSPLALFLLSSIPPLFQVRSQAHFLFFTGVGPPASRIADLTHMMSCTCSLKYLRESYLSHPGSFHRRRYRTLAP